MLLRRNQLTFIWTATLGLIAVLWFVINWLQIFQFSATTEVSLLSAIVLLVVAILAEELTVEFSPGIFVSIGSLPILLAVIFINPLTASLIALSTAFVASRKLRFSSIAFNSINYVLSTAAASISVFIVSPLIDVSKDGVNVALLVVATIGAFVFLLVDFFFGSIFVKIRDGLEFRKTWSVNFINALPSQGIFVGVSLIVVAIYAKAGTAAAVLFLIPIFASQHIFKLLVQQKELLGEQKKMSQDLMNMNVGLAGALIMLLDSKDSYTASHSASVAMYCRDMATMMGMSEDKQHSAHMAGLLHDLGKVGTPDSVLKKEGELTNKEWEQVKQHPTTAAEALSQLTTHKEVANIIRHHQEHFDGSGYPHGLAGEDIPEISRMLAVADTYHALTSDRPYREAMSPFEALITLRRVAGTQLDPKYVEVLAQVLKNEDLSYREGSKTDFLSEFRKGRPAFESDALRAQLEDNKEIHPG